MTPSFRAKGKVGQRRRRAWRLGLILAAVVMSAAMWTVVAQGVTAWQTGDVFAGVGNGQYKVYDNNGVFKETIQQPSVGFTTGCQFNNAQDHLYTTNFSTNEIVRFQDPSPHTVDQVLPTPGITLAPGPDAANESISFMANGNYLVGHADGGADVHQYTELGVLVAEYDVATETRGSDWIDLAANQTTLFYTSEGTRVLRFDIGTNTQMADFATGLPGSNAYALRILPPGDGSAGVLVADTETIVRLNGSGAVVQTYDVAGEDAWFALNLDPNGTSFWSGSFDTNNFYRFNIATGAVEVGPIASGGDLFGLCLKGEPTAGGGGPGPPFTLDLQPFEDVNDVGTQHCLTATVTDEDGDPVPGITVVFDVEGASEADQNPPDEDGSAVTNDQGVATFCYTGPDFPGKDVINAFADTDEDGMQDLPPPLGDEPFDVADKLWVLPVTTPLCEVKVNNGGWIIASNGDRASFGGMAKADGEGNTSGNEEYQDHGPMRPMNLHGNVLVVVCETDTSATIYGMATVDGAGSFVYRLKVEDNGEGGKGVDKYWITVDNGYDSGNQTLRGGNVQVHDTA